MITKQFLRARDAASYLGVSADTLAKWRCTGGKIPYSRIGRTVVYDLADLDEYAARHKYRSTSDLTANERTSVIRPRSVYASGAELAALKHEVTALNERLAAIERFLRALQFPRA